MLQEPVYESICFSGKKVGISEKLRPECKTEIPSEAVGKVLSVNAFAVINNSEVSDGHVKYGGKIMFYVCYESEGSLKKCECGSEFLGDIATENAESGCNEYVSVCVEKTDYDLSGVRLSVFANITVNAELCSSEKLSALSNGEGLVLDKRDITYSRSYGVKKGAYPVEEEFELSYPVAEVLSHKAGAVLTAVQCGVGCIIVDGEVHISALLLQNSEKSDIIRENRTLPFRMEIEYDEAMPTMQAAARVSEKSFKTDISVDADNNKSIVNVNVVLQFEGEAFSEENATIAADAFSLTDKVEPEFGEYDYRSAAELRSCRTRIGIRAVMDEIPAGSRLMTIGGEKAEVVSVDCSDGIKITGIFTAYGYFRDFEGGNFTVRLEAPFETSPDCPSLCDCEQSATVFVDKVSARLVSLTEAELEADLIITVCSEQKNKIRFIKDIKSLGEKEICDSAISVYIPLEGEDLWSLAKRLNACPDEICATNKDLQFPLTGKERILVYRRK